MNILLQIDDAKLFDLSKMPNIPALLDKAYKDTRSTAINELAHERRVFVSFDAWFLSLNPGEREHTLKSLRSTIDLEEIIPTNIPNRELVMEAARRYRENVQTTEEATEIASETTESEVSETSEISES